MGKWNPLWKTLPQNVHGVKPHPPTLKCLVVLEHFYDSSTAELAICVKYREFPQNMEFSQTRNSFKWKLWWTTRTRRCESFASIFLAHIAKSSVNKAPVRRTKDENRPSSSFRLAIATLKRLRDRFDVDFVVDGHVHGFPPSHVTTLKCFLRHKPSMKVIVLSTGVARKIFRRWMCQWPLQMNSSFENLLKRGSRRFRTHYQWMI